MEAETRDWRLRVETEQQGRGRKQQGRLWCSVLWRCEVLLTCHHLLGDKEKQQQSLILWVATSILENFISGYKEKRWKIIPNLFLIAFWPSLLCHVLKRSGEKDPIVAISLYCRAGLTVGGWLSTRCQAAVLCVLSEFTHQHE